MPISQEIQQEINKINNNTLDRLQLYNLHLNAEEVKAIAEALKTNNTVTEVTLSGNKIKDVGAKAIADALKANKTVTEVILTGNEIGDEGAEAIADALKVNKALTKVILTANKIGPVGAKAIAEALKTNTTVTIVYLNFNNIEAEGRNALEAAKLNVRTGEVIREPKINLNKCLNYIGNHKEKFVLAGVAACVIVGCYKKPEILTNLKDMFFALFDKASSFVMGK